MTYECEQIFINGDSIANVVQYRDKHGEDMTTQENSEVRSRTDYKQRLSTKGVSQAIQVREWINTNISGVGNFDS